MTATAHAEHKSFSAADEARSFEHGHIDVVHVGGADVGRAQFEPGWRWSVDVKPVVGTDLCEIAHFQYQLAGTLHVQMADGSSFDVHAGEVAVVPPGHDAWVVGDEPVVAVDWSGASTYAKR
jgi:hypothetical protein